MFIRWHWLRAKWRAASVSDRLYWSAVVLVFAYGVALRSARFFLEPIALWGDEAMWASRMIEQPLLAPSFRPVGFMALCSGLVTVLGVDERALRLPSYLASVGVLVLLLRVGDEFMRATSRRRVARRGALLLLLAVASLHPMLVDFAREFKPYALEMFIHLLLVDRLLSYRKKPSWWGLVGLLLLAPLSFLLAYNAIFAFPLVFGLLAWWSWSEGNRRRLTAVASSAAVTLGTIAAAYALIFSQIPKGEDDSSFWGKKYGVFFIDDERGNWVQWSVAKLQELVAFPGAGRLFWTPMGQPVPRAVRELAGFETLLWGVLFVVGGYVLWRRKEHFLILLLPILTVMLFNALGLWPWGAFRTNLFLLAYVFPVPFVALAACASRSPWAARLAVPTVAAFFVVPTFAFGLGFRTEKRAWTGHSEFPAIVERIVTERQRTLALRPDAPKEAVFLDAYTCEAYKFYFKHHAAFKQRYAEYSRQHLAFQCIQGIQRTAAAVQRRAGAATWVVVSKRTLVEPQRRAVQTVAKVVLEDNPSYNHLLIKTEGAL